MSGPKTAPGCRCRGWKQIRRIALRRDGNEIEFTISDEGAGFDWLPYLQLDPDRAFDLNGRGIAMANMLGFSSLEYQGAGNIVVARAEAIRQPTLVRNERSEPLPACALIRPVPAAI